MALGKIEEKSRRYYLSLSDGRLYHSEDGERKYYSYVEGVLERIYQKERTFNGETVLYWYLDIRGEKKELYSLALPYKSGAFKSIVLSLASDETIGFSTIKIEPYKKGEFTKVVTSCGGRRLDWITKELPEVETIYIADQPVKDDTKRMKYINSLVETINQRIKGK